MKTQFTLFALLGAFVLTAPAYATDFVLIRDLAHTRVFDQNGKVRYQGSYDSFKNFEVRGDRFVVQNQFNLVSWIDSSGTPLVKDQFGSSYSVSNELLAVYNEPGNGSVFDRAGKKIYSSIQVQSIHVSNNGFAVRESDTGRFEVYSKTGKLLFADMEIEKASISDSFIATVSNTGLFQIRNYQGEALKTDSAIHAFSISNSLYAVEDASGWTTITNQAGNEIFSGNEVRTVLKTKYAVTLDTFGAQVYSPTGDRLELLSPKDTFTFADQMITDRDSTGALAVYSPVDHLIFSRPGVNIGGVQNESFTLQNSSMDYDWLSSSGEPLRRIFDSNLTGVAVGNELLAVTADPFQTTSVYNTTSADAVVTVEYSNEVRVVRSDESTLWAQF